ncbi:hypothetical protein ACFP1Z_32755 [Streptomyces gamaensis]|uniref:Uncharacterized protein n=1 Tax=Streptomyces gamaensis TaxID=1763542 RepID=A0ABW0ZAU5_9ACTN
MLARQMYEATADLEAALDSLLHLIAQVKEAREPVSGVHECFAQCFGQVEKALIKREVIERFSGAKLSP